MLAELETLERRLNDGHVKIEDAQQALQDVARWEDLWLQLLGEYERLYAVLDKEIS